MGADLLVLMGAEVFILMGAEVLILIDQKCHAHTDADTRIMAEEKCFCEQRYSYS